MNIKELNECLKNIVEGEVIDFTSYRNKKQGTSNDTMLIDIKSVKVLWCEGGWFDDNEVLSFEDFQNQVYQYDTNVQEENRGGYDKCKYEATLKITYKGETYEDTYTGRIDLGDGKYGLEEVTVQTIMANFIEENADVEKVIFEHPMTSPTVELYHTEQQKEDEKEYETINVDKAPEDVEVGDILYSVWGYSMVLVDFYKVIKRTASSIKLQELDQDIVSGDGMQGTVIPNDKVKESQYVDGKTFRISKNNFGYVTKVNGHPVSYWNGQPIGFDHMD